MRFYEIARIPQGDFGDKDTLYPMDEPQGTQPLPGGSGYTYTVQHEGDLKQILIFGSGKLIAELDISPVADPLDSYKVETVAVDPDYRSKGLGMALYGIALSILKITLRAGDTQTKHGQAMWLKLNRIPGVEVRGIATQRQREYNPQPGDEIEYETDRYITYSFPVAAGSRSMKAARRGRSIYSGTASMIARWRGRES
jgi:GNAT superfamily N-acetyltransferase